MTEHHQGRALEIGDPHPAAPPRGGLRRGRDHDQVLVEQLHGGQRGRGGRQGQHDQGEIERTARQLPYEVVRAALLQQQPDARMQIVEGAQDVRQQTRAEAGGRPEPDPSPPQLHQLLHLVPGGVRVREDPAGQRQQCLARVGEGDVAPCPAEQFGAQLVLQRPDLLGERRLRDMHRLGGAGEVPGLGDGHEIGELLEVHAPTITRHDR
ncbi:hypothetical protein ACVWXU_001825 [Streptomyces sp. TE33382]